MKKETVKMILVFIESLLQHMINMTTYLSSSKSDRELIQATYEKFRIKMRDFNDPTEDDWDDRQLRDFLFYLKIDTGDFIEFLDTIYYKNLNEINSYGYEIQKIYGVLNNMKSEIEKQVNVMGDVITEHQKNIEALSENQSLLLGLSNITISQDISEPSDVLVESDIED